MCSPSPYSTIQPSLQRLLEFKILSDRIHLQHNQLESGCYFINDFEQLVSYLEGNFSNEQQFSELTETGQSGLPFMIHKSHVSNGRILNPPENSRGIFLLEENYYALNGKGRFKSGIFLFEVNSPSSVKLSSITVPKNYANKKYKEVESIPFSEVTISEKLVPIAYKKENETFID